jgi:DNA-binding MarR family transcriptional regulator
VLKIHPSRLVAIIDDLESRGLVERGESDEDRRTYALHLTAKGKTALAEIGRLARDHEALLCAALDDQERAMLAELLARIAEEQGLTPQVHPGFSHVGTRRPGGAS